MCVKNYNNNCYYHRRFISNVKYLPILLVENSIHEKKKEKKREISFVIALCANNGTGKRKKKK